MAPETGLWLTVLIWGANFSFIKLGLTGFPPFAFAGLRFTLAMIVLVTLLRRKEGVLPWPTQDGWRLLWLGLVGNTLYQALFMVGLTRTTVANAALIIATTPVMVAVLGALTGLERLTRPVLVGVTLAFLGVALVLTGRGADLSVHTLLGDAAIFGCAVCWACYTVGLRTVQTPMSSLRVTTLTMLTGTPGLLLLGLPGLLRMDWRSVGARAWVGTAYATVFGLVIAYIMWNRGIRRVGSSRTAVYGTAVPAVAMLLAWPLLGERPYPLQIAGAGLIVGGVVLSRQSVSPEG